MDEVKKNQEILDRIRGKQETDSRHDGLLVDVFEENIKGKRWFGRPKNSFVATLLRDTGLGN